MSFDGIFTHAMVNELAPLLVGGRISRINQPYPNELILVIRANRHNYPLLLSAHPTYARLQVTEIPYVNPAKPTKFTMTLRKYLDGALLKQLSQKENDRVVHLTFTSRNELGDLQNISLIIEMMGRHSNLILLQQDTGRILDTVRHVSSDQNRYRLLMPGATYIEPPKQDNVNPFKFDAGDYLKGLPQTADVFKLAKKLQQDFQGLGFDSSVELATRLAQQSNPLTTWQDFFTAIDQTPKPTVTRLNERQQMQFSAIDYQSEKGQKKNYSGLSHMLDQFYRDKVELDRVHQQGSQLIHFVQNELKKDRKKLKKLTQTLKNSEKANDYRIKGEILTTYLNRVERGMTSIELPNYYADERPLKINLSNQISPSQNAQKYFTKYQKLKNAVHYVNDQMTETQQEVDYLSGILAQIEIAAPKDLTDIQEELFQQGYLHRKQQKNKKIKRPKLSKPDQFYASAGTSILVGKNNLQNDRLTLKTARKTDIWLHAKNVPGSHVIIAQSYPSEKTLAEAANLAAYFSKSRLSATVPVDYVQVKRVHKPNGAKPGFVIYEGQHTLFVTPDEALVEKLSKQPN
ncbi:NFACT RNA binding domain-containing protein [Loigolactobacillus backii]|uniref:NFACT RNA binding domain-containing protein n=1 Tax=Loigolactobacillus backii TaxID=375175 RepID=UPI0022FD6BEA|nr:NFACT RNA binding domain-containing protein [Loigolactobacillus backii]MDA5387031.1 NFACT family protein [Loigolactobacillus backii]MDA5389569.1 NFACT family protein [Loigolactobacillus backii]